MASLTVHADDESGRWAAVDGVRLECWEDGCVAYHPLSGETHLLGHPIARLLECLQEGPKSLGELRAGLAAKGEPSERWGSLYTWLRQLAEAHLIRHHSP